MRTSSSTTSARRGVQDATVAMKRYAKVTLTNNGDVDCACGEGSGCGRRRRSRPCSTASAATGCAQSSLKAPTGSARDLAVQLAGHDYLKDLGVSLIPASAPDFFLEDTPTTVLVRQVFGAIAQFDKATIVAKLKAARDRKREATGKCEGRKSYGEANPEMVGLAQQIKRQAPECLCARYPLSLLRRDIGRRAACHSRLPRSLRCWGDKTVPGEGGTVRRRQWPLNPQW